MKKLLPTVIFCLLIFNWTELNFVYANKSVEIRSVLELKRQGWEVLEKQSEVESRPGLKPYQNLKREIHIVKYRLRKGKEFVFCLVEYDSQLDTIREACDVSQEKAEKRLDRRAGIQG
jgi:hypothetical protein